MVPSTSQRRPRHHTLAEGVIYREAEGKDRPVHFYIRPKDDDTDVIVVSFAQPPISLSTLEKIYSQVLSKVE